MRAIFVVLALVGMLLLAGCASKESTGSPTIPPTNQTQLQTPPASPPTAQPPPTTPKTPSDVNKAGAANIATFTAVKEGAQYRFYFLLEDINGANTAAAGKVKVRVFDDVNSTLYVDEFDVKSSDYVDYQFKLTGQEMGKAYEWRTPASQIKKGVASMWGTAQLTFVTSDGTEIQAEDKTMNIPTYTQEELAQMAEVEYAKTATVVNKKLSKGSFEVTVEKIGFVNITKYSTTTQYLRVDMIVKNVGSESEYFSPSGMVLLSGQGKQYESAYGGTLDTYSQIYPGITKDGYVLFEDVPTTETGLKLIFELGYDANYDQYTFQYQLT
jgi:hypothetical protein